MEWHGSSAAHRHTPSSCCLNNNFHSARALYKNYSYNRRRPVEVVGLLGVQREPELGEATFGKLCCSTPSVQVDYNGERCNAVSVVCAWRRRRRDMVID